MAWQSVVFFKMFVWTVLLKCRWGFHLISSTAAPFLKGFSASLSPRSCKSLQVSSCIHWKNRFDRENEWSPKAVLVLGTLERLVHAGEWKNKEGMLLGLNFVFQDVWVKAVVSVLVHHHKHLSASWSVAGSLPVASALGERVSVLSLN